MASAEYSDESSSGEDDHDISDENNCDSSNQDDSQDDFTDDEDEQNSELHVAGLIDDEAEEDDERSQSTDEVDEWQSSSLNRDQSFHYFTRLPVEVRHLIWKHFCPDLEQKPRVLAFRFDCEQVESDPFKRPRGRSPSPDNGRILDGLFLEGQTEALRAVMAVDRESRALARSYFPDNLCFDSGCPQSALAAFNKAHDVVMLEFILMEPSTIRSVNTTGFLEHVVNLAIDMTTEDAQDSDIPTHDASEIVEALSMFPSLKRVYLARGDDLYRLRELNWCVQDEAHQFAAEYPREEVSSFEGAPLLNFAWVVCWPNVDRYPDFAETHGSPRPAPLWLRDVQSALSSNGVKLLHMVVFELDAANLRYRRLQEIEEYGNSFCNSDSSQEDSEYGSDTGDYAQLEEDELNPYFGFYYGNNNSAPTHTHGAQVETTDDDSFIDDGEIVHDGSLSDDDLDLADESSSTATGPAIISSLPSEIDREKEGEEAQAVSELRRRVAKRKVVCESESDDDELEEPIAKQPRVSRAMISHLESDHQGSNATTTGSDQEDSSDASSSENDEHEHRQQEQHMSLFERLEAARQAHPVDTSENLSSKSNEDDDGTDGLNWEDSGSDQVDESAVCLNGQESISGELEDGSDSALSPSVDPSWDDDASD
ncbi:hypothetical protein CDD81_7592 [Ophiocordyceps australis]|uniref:2EXR domain-containing protein n=1 Tax=Ophiocordyceps australis TaxID=1399860 RepID=A0A2C5X8Z4_9HYPO|nr:hypothetical protein CDD81_7592 [Ophiocordyceps australis]